MDWVNFEEIKRLVPLEKVIDWYRIPLRRVNAATLRGHCPLPSHGSERSRESFTATLTKGTGGAWACQSQSCVKARGRVGGNVLDFVAAMEKCSVRDAAIKLQTWFLVLAAGGGDARSESRAAVQDGNEEASTRDAPAKEPGENKPLSFALKNIDHAHPYLHDRGVSHEVATTFGIGYFPGKGSMSGRMVIPIHNPNGELVAYAGRAIDGTEPKYKFPAGFRKSLELFNLHRVKDELSVVLVEGFFDCVRVSQSGFPCVALMGSTMSVAQEKALAEHFPNVIVMMDGDEAGRRATDEIAERLRSSVFRVDVIDLSDGTQPDELSNDELQILLDRVL